jgi:predicted nuclease of predicted toxin-antitoxin system
LRLLIDQNVPDSVAQHLKERGHEIELVRESLGRASVDQLIAVTAALEGIIVVTFDKDFERLKRLLSKSGVQPFCGRRRHPHGDERVTRRGTAAQRN